MIYTINNCIRAFGYTNFDRLIEDMGSIDGLKEYVRANGYADIAVAEDTELLLVDVNGKTWHTGCYGAKLGPEPEYLCFTSTGDSTVAMTQTGTPNKSANKVIQYKLNNGQWQTWDMSAISLSDGDKMYLKSDDETPIAEQTYIYKYFIMSGSISASGNIMSLLNFSDTLTDYAFFDLFKDCTSLTTAPELPPTTLTRSCYSNMFYGCTSLTQAPTLPATTLANDCYHSMFNGCTSLTTTPALPAISLGEGCYANMFKGCTSLVQAPELPATTLNSECYVAMFSGCTSLAAAPELPATTLQYRCYKQMFYNCTSLTQALALPATTLAEECYNEMFKRCTSLVQAPSLPATTLAQYCYTYMLSDCTSLTQAPSLPATTLAQGCYTEMFMNCTSLMQAPELPAITLTPYCYVEMFSGCTNLNYVKAMFTDISAQGCLNSWLENVSPTGTFIKSKDATWTNEQAGIPTGWTVQVEGGVTPEPEPERDYLCFTSTGDSTVSMTQKGTPDASANKVIQYKLNDGQWQNWDLSAVTLADGDKMYLKSDDEIPISENYNIYKKFVMTGSIAASGNIMSLLNFSTTLTDFAFKSLFYSCKSLTTAPELPATILTPSCYSSMFQNCTNLNYVKAMFTTIPSTGQYITSWLNNVSPTGTFIKSKDATWTNEQAGIPTGWTVQVEGGVTPEPEPERDYLCFTSTGDSTVAMEQSGTLDTSANKVIQYKLNNGQWQNWDLSAVALADGDNMYLKSDDEIPMGKVINYVIVYKKFVMTGSIATSGNVMSLLNFSDTLPDNAFYGLFENCTSLTSAPTLPATTLADFCYSHMFENCTSLTQAPALPVTKLASQCYGWMFEGCSSLTQAPELPATTLVPSCYSGMFKGCSSLTTAPALPATELAYSCYYNMFNGCTSLTTAPALPATTLAQECYYSMFEGCTSLTTAPALPVTNLAPQCYGSMFWGCTSLATAPALPATTLASSCYSNMFYGCTSLTTAPALPATTLTQECYSSMFSGCTSLTQAPELPATTLTSHCYYWMFYGCSKLNYVKAMFTDISVQECLENWLTGVSPTGTFVKNASATWPNEHANIPTGWTVETASPDK